MRTVARVLDRRQVEASKGLGVGCIESLGVEAWKDLTWSASGTLV